VPQAGAPKKTETGGSGLFGFGGKGTTKPPAPKASVPKAPAPAAAPVAPAAKTGGGLFGGGGLKKAAHVPAPMHKAKATPAAVSVAASLSGPSATKAKAQGRPEEKKGKEEKKAFFKLDGGSVKKAGGGSESPSRLL